jgi:hypothetical protein
VCTRSVHANGVGYSSNSVDVKDIRLPINMVYTGALKAGKPHGKGKAVSASGSSYNGSWCDGLYHFEGTQTVVAKKRKSKDAIVSKYTGTFLKGQRSGHGLEETTTDTYIGSWYCDRRCGEGVELTQLDTYIGSFENGVRHGVGMSITATGTTYAGKWRAGKRHGTGVYYDRDQPMHVQHQ